MPSNSIAKTRVSAIDSVATSGYFKNEALDKANTSNKYLGVKLPINLLNLLLGFFLFLSIQTNAQSRHYWSQNFNTESSLVAGAVIGGDAGPSAVYYNPALIKEDNIDKNALSANLFSFQNTKLDKLASSGTEYDPVTNIALQGQVAQDMDITFSEVSIFFGLTYGIGK